MQRVEPLGAKHDRLAFTCGDSALDRFLRAIAYQAQRKGICTAFVAVDAESPSKILGYYTLSSYLISGLCVPEPLRKRRNLPTHMLGATLLGRLAVDASAQGNGLGAALLFDALRRACAVASDVGSTCLVVDAANDRAERFYQRFGFVKVSADSSRLLLPLDSAMPLVTESQTASRSARVLKMLGTSD